MEFARKQLLKYGWTEGKGLGKNENGISEALKPKLKFDTTGVGHDSAEQFTFNWWENVYNNAADNINVKNGVDINLTTGGSVNITTKKYSVTETNRKKGLEYGSFLRTSKLTAEGTVDHEDKQLAVVEEAVKVVNLTDEELFKACGGRTAHKGARHGVKMNGKSARLAKQEEELLKLFTEKKSSTPDQTEETTKKKKKKKDKNIESTDQPSTSKKKRKRENEIDELEKEAMQKRYEDFCDRKNQKKINVKRRKEEKQFKKITEMIDNVDLNREPQSEDDGFEEGVVVKKIKLSKKSKKKKKQKTEEIDDLMTEIRGKLTKAKELRKKLKHEKDKSDCKRIEEVSEDLVNCTF